MTNQNTQKISEAEMTEAILKSGYLIEQRIDAKLKKLNYNVIPNDVYKDSDTEKTREIDLYASKSYHFEEEEHIIDTDIFIECENNKHPVVLFKSEGTSSDSIEDNLITCGIPNTFIKEGNYTSLPSLLEIEKYHHYYSVPISTQYCSFQNTEKNKSKAGRWIALHPDSQHASFSNLIKCIRYNIDEDLVGYYKSQTDDSPALEKFELNIVYPLIILQGELYEASIEEGNLKLEKKQHLQLQKTEIHFQTPKSYQIDIITEDYLEKYIQIVEDQTKKMIAQLKEKKGIIKESLKHSYLELIDAKTNEEYRDVLT